MDLCHGVILKLIIKLIVDLNITLFSSKMKMWYFLMQNTKIANTLVEYRKAPMKGAEKE